jgi:cephalosporin hydroxylase
VSGVISPGRRSVLTTFSGRNASQSEFELQSFVAFMLSRECARYLEIGARHGDTFHHIVGMLGPASVCVAVDMPGASWGTASSVKSLMRARQDLQRRGYNVEVLIGDSHDADVIGACRAMAPYDFALIDADHSYAAVAQDFRDYAPMAKYVAFHDIVGDTQATTRNGQRIAVEVPRLWAELRDKFESWEFVDDGSQMGIGVIKVDGHPGGPS